MWLAGVGPILLGFASSARCGCHLNLTLVFDVVLFMCILALVGDIWAICTAPCRHRRSFSFSSSCCRSEAYLLAAIPPAAEVLAAVSPLRRTSLLAGRLGLAIATFIVPDGLGRVLAAG
jgi:hypothetical protein